MPAAPPRHNNSLRLRLPLLLLLLLPLLFFLSLFLLLLFLFLLLLLLFLALLLLLLILLHIHVHGFRLALLLFLLLVLLLLFVLLFFLRRRRCSLRGKFGKFGVDRASVSGSFCLVFLYLLDSLEKVSLVHGKQITGMVTYIRNIIFLEVTLIVIVVVLIIEVSRDSGQGLLDGIRVLADGSTGLL